MGKTSPLGSDFYQAANGEAGWIAQICAILALTWLASFVVRRIVKKIRGDVNAAPANLAQISAEAARAPVVTFIWIGGLSVICSVLYARFPITVLQHIVDFRQAMHSIVVGWFLLRLTPRMFVAMAERSPAVTAAAADTLEKVATAIIVVVIALIVLPSFGFSIDGLLAFGGVGGIVVGFAAKDILSNVFGAVMIHFDRPFLIGDWVYLPEKNVEGTVEHIGWRQVVIRTFDKRLIYVPNSTFSTMVLINPGRMTHRRLFEKIGIRYDDIKRVKDVMQDVRLYLDNHPDIDQNLDRVVRLDKFGASSVDFLVVALSRRTGWADFLALREEIMLAIAEIIAKHGAEFAFPTQTLHIADMPTCQKLDTTNGAPLRSTDNDNH